MMLPKRGAEIEAFQGVKQTAMEILPRKGVYILLALDRRVGMVVLWKVSASFLLGISHDV
jgi:hypothetical protein